MLLSKVVKQVEKKEKGRKEKRKREERKEEGKAEEERLIKKQESSLENLIQTQSDHDPVAAMNECRRSPAQTKTSNTAHDQDQDQDQDRDQSQAIPTQITHFQDPIIDVTNQFHMPASMSTMPAAPSPCQQPSFPSSSSSSSWLGPNSAQHDYQTQLMLLEMQNKRRLELARQEENSKVTMKKSKKKPSNQTRTTLPAQVLIGQLNKKRLPGRQRRSRIIKESQTASGSESGSGQGQDQGQPRILDEGQGQEQEQ